MTVDFKLLSSGYCTASKSHALRGSGNKTIRFYATWGYIQHPVHGHILFDTGYTRRFYEITRRWPFSLYAKMTPVFVTESDEAVSQLKAKGIDPADISTIIVSHFHADHIGGLKDFPNARFICSQKAYEAVKDRKGFGAVRKGYLPAQMPDDFKERVSFIDFDTATSSDPQLGRIVDYYGDGSIRFCELDGHATGQIGTLLNTETGTVLLCADAAWLKENYQDLHLPSQLVRLFFDSWSDYKASLKRVHDFHKANPEAAIIPCHCEETLKDFTSNQS